MDPSHDLTKEKVLQAAQILKEKNIDLWLTFVRETAAGGDPVIPLIYGHDLTWQSALIITKNGESLAIVGHFEKDAAESIGAYNQVIPYHEGISPVLLAQLDRLDPKQIAINYSPNDFLADGLSLGMYLTLQDYLKDTPYIRRLVSAEEIVQTHRGRKTETEIARIKQAIKTTEEIYAKTFDYVEPGMTERQVGEFMHEQVAQLDLKTAWEYASCPAVNSGPLSPVGHAGPTDIVLERGHILHFDFGVRQSDYNSDIQRLMYLLKPRENKAPAPVQKGFDTIVEAIQRAVDAMKPGIAGYEVDQIARSVVTSAGYPEFKYATGHHLGRLTHDGGGVLGPIWERYGDTPKRILEPGHVYTVEPGLMVDGYGYIGLEEDVLVTENGTVFLSNPQQELILK